LDVRNGKMHGRGKFENEQGDVYEGEFAEDLRHGRGVMRMANGAR
jgi:hypothetical protein